MSIATKMINDNPYLEYEYGDNLLPQMILNPGRFIGSFDLEETSDLSNVNMMIGRVRDILKDFKESRKQELILTSEKYMPQYFRNKANARKYEIGVNDLVLIKDKDKYDDYTFGRVKSIHGSDAILTTKYGEVRHQIALLNIYAPSTLSVNKK